MPETAYALYVGSDWGTVSGSARNAACSSCKVARPAARRMALRSHCRRKSSRSVPIASWSTDSEIQWISATPATAVTAVNANRAATVPARAARQLRLSPMARTMVNASTNSAADARNVAEARPSHEGKASAALPTIRA
jgi:hypothetical protein